MKCFEFSVSGDEGFPERGPDDELGVLQEQEIMRPEDNPEIKREC